MKKWFFLAFIFIWVEAKSQDAESRAAIDSLKRLLIQDLSDTSKIQVLHKLSKALQKNSLDDAKRYAQQELSTAKKVKDVPFLARGYTNIGSLNRLAGDYKEALIYFDSANVVLTENRQDSLQHPRRYKMADAGYLRASATLLTKSGDLGEALERLLKALKLYESLEDYYSASLTLNGVSDVFFEQEKYDDAINYALQASEYAKKSRDKNSVVYALFRLATGYGAKGDLDKAIEVFKDQVSVFEETKDLKRMCSALNNIATAYGYKKDYNSALTYAQRALEIAERIGDPAGMPYRYETVGDIYHAMEDYDKALEYILKASSLAEKLNEKRVLRIAYTNLTDIYTRKKQHQEALKYQTLLMNLKDSLFSEKSSKQIAEMQTKYETEQKEQENELLKKESEVQELQINRQKTTIYVGGGGFILILSLAGVVYRSYRQKKKANNKLMEKNEIIRAKTQDLHKKNQQITDSIDYAQRIQQAVLPDKQYIESIFPESFIFFRPKDRVSGDFYWMHKEGDQVLFAAADCTGHGVPGAFMSLICTDLLNNIMLDGIFTPSVILEELGNRLVSHLKQKQEAEGNDGIKDALDIALCNYNTTTKELVYSGAHNSLYLVRDNELKEYKADKLHIGIDRKENSEFTNHTISTQTGDIIYMFSDGFVDQQGGEKGKKFYYPPFRKLLLENHTKQMEDQKENLGTTITNWIGDREQIDDMLIFGVKFS